MLQIESLGFSYGERLVLKGLSFTAHEEQITVVLGANGAGKTTLLKCLCNVHRPQVGEIKVNGRALLKLGRREMAKHIGYVPQSAPVSNMTVFDAVLLGRRPHIELSASRYDIAVTASVIDAMGLSTLSLRPVSEISGGEFQKVQIARAIAQEPKVLVLDEPTNNLDIAAQHQTMQMIEQVVRLHGVCTVMTMHDINLAIHYADRFVFLRTGEIIAHGGVEVITPELIREVYGMDAELVQHRGLPMVVPATSPRS